MHGNSGRAHPIRYSPIGKPTSRPAAMIVITECSA
jgi:hypothetical protein